MMSKGVDLHTHSTASDGSFSPKELVNLAKEIDLLALALTDHDTIDGLAEAEAEAKSVGLAFVPGIEISVKFEGPGHFHLLGYFIDYQENILTKTLVKLKEARASRNQKMIAKLKELGVPITWEEVLAVSGGGEIGRPHIAKVLVDKGIVKDTDEAFSRYLAKGAAAYVPKARLDPEEAIELIHEAKGLTSLAHPYYLKLSNEELEKYVAYLKQKGLDAIEAYYTDHSPEYTAFCLELARKYNLLVTGGSDFHGANKPEIKLGVGKGSLFVPEEVYFRLKAAWEERLR